MHHFKHRLGFQKHSVLRFHSVCLSICLDHLLPTHSTIQALKVQTQQEVSGGHEPHASEVYMWYSTVFRGVTPLGVQTTGDLLPIIIQE